MNFKYYAFQAGLWVSGESGGAHQVHRSHPADDSRAGFATIIADSGSLQVSSNPIRVIKSITDD